MRQAGQTRQAKKKPVQTVFSTAYLTISVSGDKKPILVNANGRPVVSVADLTRIGCHCYPLNASVVRIRFAKGKGGQSQVRHCGGTHTEAQTDSTIIFPWPAEGSGFLPTIRRAAYKLGVKRGEWMWMWVEWV